MRKDKTLISIINKISIKYRVSPQEVEKILDHVLISVRNSLRRDEMPKVLLHDFGTFNARESQLNGALSTLDEKLKNKTITQEEYDTKTDIRRKVLKRIRNERL